MTPPEAPLLTLTDVRFGFEDRPDFLGPVSLAVHPGDCWGIIGPNGAGKSTLLRLMAGLLAPRSGAVRLYDRPLHPLPHGRVSHSGSAGASPSRGGSAGPLPHGRGSVRRPWSLAERSRHIAFVPQQVHNDVAMGVREVVLMGRFPHRSLGLFESTLDYEAAKRAMELTQTEAFADRALATLSGGEAQRVHVAGAIAQHTELLLLDEPTASLDLQFQIDMFGLLRSRAEAHRQGVVVVTHDVNLAGAFCNKVALLHDGRCVAQGPPAEVIRSETLERVYGVKMVAMISPDDPSRPWFVPSAVGAPSNQPAHSTPDGDRHGPDQGGAGG